MEKKSRLTLDKIIAVLAVIMALFQIYASLFRPFSDIILQNYHLAFAYVIIFLMALKESRSKKLYPLRAVIYAAMILITLACIGYMVFNYQHLVTNVGRVESIAYVVGALLAIVTLYATYKSFGAAIPILTIIVVS